MALDRNGFLRGNCVGTIIADSYTGQNALNRDIQDILELVEHAEQIEQAARAMKAIAHPLRLKILCVLGEQQVSVQEIVEAVGTSQSNISQHLAILRDKGILLARKEANRVYYRVTDQRILRLILMMRELFCRMLAHP